MAGAAGRAAVFAAAPAPFPAGVTGAGFFSAFGGAAGDLTAAFAVVFAAGAAFPVFVEAALAGADFAAGLLDVAAAPLLTGFTGLTAFPTLAGFAAFFFAGFAVMGASGRLRTLMLSATAESEAI